MVDPRTGEYIPVHSIKEAMGFIGEITDAMTKISLSEKIPLLLAGAYRGAEKTSRQYLNEILDKKGFDGNKKDELLEVFTKFFSHGYPMSRDFLTQNGIKLDTVDEETEAMFADLHSIWCEYLHSIDAQAAQDALILQTNDAESVAVPDKHREPTAQSEE